MKNTRIRVGLIGFGRMGRFYLDEMKKSDRWDIAYICDINPQAREAAKSLSPESNVVDDENIVFEPENLN